MLYFAMCACSSFLTLWSDFVLCGTELIYPRLVLWARWLPPMPLSGSYNIMAVYFTLFRNETDCAKGNYTVLGYIKGKLPCKINTFWIDVAQVSQNLGDLPQFFQHVLNKWEILKTTILAREVWPQESPLKLRDYTMWRKQRSVLQR